MGGKGGSSVAPPPAVDPNMVSNMQAQNQVMMDAYQQQISMILQQSMDMQRSIMNNQTQVAPLPELEAIPEVNWEAKIAELNAKSVNMNETEQEKKKTLTDTILTSPLLDDEEASTTQLSLLGR